MKEWIWYLFVNGKILKKSKDIEELKQDIVNMQLHIDTAMQPKYVSIQRNDIWLQRML